MRFTKPKKVVGLDVGTHAVKAIQMSRSGHKLSIEGVGYALVDRNQVNVDPVTAQAEALREAIRNIAVNQCLVVGALPGQTVVIRYPRLGDIPVEDIDKAIESEASQNIPYDLSEVFLDWSLLDEETDAGEKHLKVLLVAAKNEVIESRVLIAETAEVEYNMLSVDSLALADAAEGCQMLSEDESVALINIGASSVSIHFMKDGVSNFIRDISWGAREMIQAIAKSRRCEYEQAEAVLFGYEEEMLSAGSDVVEAAPVADTAEIDQAQTEPESEDHGSSLLDPLAEELEDLADMPPPLPTHSGDEFLDQTPLDEILGMPISRLVAEVRRSFDYYEHQLYERPVERIILSGGVAHIPQIREALMEDLGTDDVCIADPTAGGIEVRRTSGVEEFEEHPAQFMVAIGLAARGVAEL